MNWIDKLLPKWFSLAPPPEPKRNFSFEHIDKALKELERREKLEAAIKAYRDENWW